MWLTACVVLDFITVPILQGFCGDVDTEVSRVDDEEENTVSLKVDELFQPYVKTVIPKFGSNGMLAWRLIDTLLDILNPLTESPDWIMEEETFRRNFRQQFGILRSRKFLTQIHVDVDDLVAATSASPIKAKLPASSKPMVSAAEGVDWLLYRCLCSFVENGVVVEGEPVSEWRGNLAALAIERILSLSLNVRSAVLEYHNFECINIIARLSFTIQAMKIDFRSEWAQAVLDLLQALVSQQGENIKELVKAHRSAKKALFPGLTIYQHFSHLPRQQRKSDEPSLGVHSLYDFVLHIRNCLGLSILEEEWNKVMRVILNEAQSTEKKSLEMRLDDHGMHIATQALEKILTEQKKVEADMLTEINEIAKDARLESMKVESTKSVECQKNEEIRRRRNIGILRNCMDHNFTLFSRDVRGESIDERQAIGGNDLLDDEAIGWDEKPVFWTLDPMENSSRCRYRLVRNYYGSRHGIASALARAGDRSKALPQEDDNNSDTSVLATGLWKDLLKYRNSDDGSAREKQEDDLDEIEEAAAESADKVLLSTEVDVITSATNSAGGKTHGRLEITRRRMTFRQTDAPLQIPVSVSQHNPEIQWVGMSYPNSSWSLNDVHSIWQRFYQFQFVGVEIFFMSKRSVFFTTADKDVSFINYFTW